MDDTIPFYDLEIDTDIANIETDCMTILEKVRPNWKKDALKFKTLTEGFANTMMLCHLKSDEEIKDGITLRIHGKDIQQLLPRQREFAGLQVGSVLDVGPRIYARFKNGICLKYLQGRTLTHKELQDEKILRLLCNKLARLHSADVSKLHVVDYAGNPYQLDDKIPFVEAVGGMVDNIPPYESIKEEAQRNRIMKEFPPLEELVQEYKKWHEEIVKADFPTTVCHNDIHHRNTIYNEETGELHLVDFEGFGKGYQSGEISKFLIIKDFFETIGMANADDKDMDIEKFTWFMKTLLSEFYQMKKGDRFVSDLELRRAVLESQILSKFYTLVFLVISLFSMHNSIVKTDTFEFGLVGHKKYASCKGELPTLFEEYKNVRKLLDDELKINK